MLRRHRLRLDPRLQEREVTTAEGMRRHATRWLKEEQRWKAQVYVGFFDPLDFFFTSVTPKLMRTHVLTMYVPIFYPR